MDKLKKIAVELDLDDKLSEFKNKFVLPKNKIYFDGNSLGLLSRDVITDINNTLKIEWGDNLISSWNNKWIKLPTLVSAKIAQIINSNEDEIYVGSSTSNNLYKLLKSLLEADSGIRNISTDSLNFPSDIYICDGISKDFKINFNLLKYNSDLYPDIEDLKKYIISNNGIVVLSHVTYKASYKYPLKEINKFCRDNNIIVIWDLSHSIGAVDINIDSDQIDYAIGCTYKYLNGGPGSPAFIFVRRNKIKNLKSPIKGWFSHNKPFDFSNTYIESNSMNKFSNGTPHILSLSTLKASLDITIQASTKSLEHKSHDLYRFFKTIYEDKLKNLNFDLISPSDNDIRGSHISIWHKEAWRISKCLNTPDKKNKKIIIVDYRPKNIIRIALTPLYTSFTDLYILSLRIVEIVSEKEYEKKDNSILGVT